MVSVVWPSSLSAWLFCSVAAVAVCAFCDGMHRVRRHARGPRLAPVRPSSMPVCGPVVPVFGAVAAARCEFLARRRSRAVVGRPAPSRASETGGTHFMDSDISGVCSGFRRAARRGGGAPSGTPPPPPFTDSDISTFRPFTDSQFSRAAGLGALTRTCCARRPSARARARRAALSRPPCP